MEKNHELVSKGFRFLLKGLVHYIARELETEYGQYWWSQGVLNVFHENQKRDLPENGDTEKLINSLDIQKTLQLFDLNWRTIFSKKLSNDHRTWAKELISNRNKLAHLGAEDLTDNDTWRALDTMSRLCDQIDHLMAEEIRALLRLSRHGPESDPASIAQDFSSDSRPSSKVKKNINVKINNLFPCWREVILPHPDVSQGRYRQAEFAADLAQVARGEGAPEYLDPVEFFARTYITDGLAGLLEQSLRRLSAKDGEPVIQLKTPFGGGKTHSMLALYHMARGKAALEKMPNLNSIFNKASLSSLPKINVAVLVGSTLNPTETKQPKKIPGISVSTLWGEIASQLALSAGKPKLYDLVKKADKLGVSPGSETLKNLFDACAPTLVLMDELVAYAKKLWKVNGLPAGTYDNLITFIQEITEAARASKNSLVVASLPESNLEIGGEAGNTVTEAIEHTFGRVESIWTPVAASEGFEVVRRRLFLNCQKTSERDLVCTAFSQMYNQNQSDFPVETKEVTYRDRMLSSYPIHPEVFDRLYEDWATLDRFQRTRGVLRLMAEVIHTLWMRYDANLMIMPGSLPLDVSNVRNELTRHLSDSWDSLVDREVDGKNSIPYHTDQNNQRFGEISAARRVARAIMLGSAPSVSAQNVRGIEASRIRLGIVEPNENIAVFNDALSSLKSSLTYLYSNSSNDRFWYDTRPTLRKTAEDRATQIKDSDAEYEIETRLHSLRKKEPLAGIHIAPSASIDVPDEQMARLVILGPKEVYKSSKEDNAATVMAAEILKYRGTGPRRFRNSLLFIAPDYELMDSLTATTKRFLAWKSIKEDSLDLNLDAAQNRETTNNLDHHNKAVNDQINEAYRWLLIPYIKETEEEADPKTIGWFNECLNGRENDIISKVVDKINKNDYIIVEFAPSLLLMELDKALWRGGDCISIKTLWEDFCSYCYLPRLAKEDVLLATIKKGLESNEYFAFASSYDGNSYKGLIFNKNIVNIDCSGLIVKISAALNQIEAQAAKTKPKQLTSVEGGLKVVAPGAEGQPPLPKAEESVKKKTTFFLSAELNAQRVFPDLKPLVEGVVLILNSEPKTKLKVSIEIEATSEDGFSDETVKIISENCQARRLVGWNFND
ncbi:MAG: DUF499 domain-containing protein [Deltaproteobacteria bacterium]|jgi:predicted AAA+ superfamily ATPase|nr:DUF499 domain-containing protein [Deltaproteobacteria bacterium]